jgi:GntP family gluconate:H+ symporter
MLAPELILLAGMATVVSLIILLRLHAFLSLIVGALTVSLLAPGDLGVKVARVATAFGTTAGSIGIVIALAAIIGMCLLESRAADRIVRAFLGLFGMRRADTALLGSGFVLSIPVFFDTVFYLLIPLAQSMYRQTGGHYAKYIMVISAGALLTHSLVPPTPGPLANAQNLGIDLGTMIIVGLAVAAPAAVAGFFVAGWLDSRLDIPLRGHEDEVEPERTPDQRLPNLAVSLLPIVMPVVLITANTIGQAVAPASRFSTWALVFGNSNFAMLAAAATALILYVTHRRPKRAEFSRRMEQALMSGGLIILITSAGGAFGAMLQAADIGPAIQSLFGDSAGQGAAILFLGFAMASLLKVAQGSSTVSMITTSAMFGALIVPDALGFHPVYLATAIGCGSMVGSWMNDSGFWVVSRMGGLTEAETFKTWTTIAATVGVAGFVVTLSLATLLPLT